MREFTVLIGQILFIALVQTVLDIFLLKIDKDKHAYLMIFINIAGIMAGLYLLLQFVFTYIMGEISTFVNFTF